MIPVVFNNICIRILYLLCSSIPCIVLQLSLVAVVVIVVFVFVSSRLFTNNTHLVTATAEFLASVELCTVHGYAFALFTTEFTCIRLAWFVYSRIKSTIILPIYSMIDENELVCSAHKQQNINFKLTKCHIAAIRTVCVRVCVCVCLWAQTHSHTYSICAAVELFERTKMC